MKITRDQAIQILKYLREHPQFYFPFCVVNKEFSDEDSDFVEIYPQEWGEIDMDEKYQTFKLWENLQNLGYDTTELMAKGFLEKIFMSSESSFLFYTDEGLTYQPESVSDTPDIENMQILGIMNGCNAREAFENLKFDFPWLVDSSFDKVVAVELKDSEPHNFYLKNR